MPLGGYVTIFPSASSKHFIHVFLSSDVVKEWFSTDGENKGPQKLWLPRSHPECVKEFEEHRFPDSQPNSSDSLYNISHAPLLLEKEGSLDQFENPLTVLRWAENRMQTFQVQSLCPTKKMRHLVLELNKIDPEGSLTMHCFSKSAFW